MPFGHDRIAEPSKPIDYTKSRPVDVMAVFNTVGEFKPLKFRVKVEDESYQTYIIESIKYTKELKGRTLLCCVYVRDGVKQDVVLGFYYEDHRWRIES
jgi:hypothetical protein